MEKYGFKIKDPGVYEIKVIDQKITTAQVNRGPADMGKYRSAQLSAESRSNPNRSRYYELIENCITDGILDALLDKRIRAVTISPPSLEGTEDEKLIQLFKAPWMTQLLRFMMESKFWGNSLVEMEYNEKAIADPELEQLFKVRLVPRRNVHPEQGIISYQADMPYGHGIPYREEPFRNFLLEFGQPRELGKFINIIPYVLFKRNNWSDFAQYNELFGMPMRVYEYDPHNLDTRKQLEEQAQKSGAAPYVIIPRGTQVQHISTSTSSGSGGYGEFNSIMNQEMTISILGQTLTTGADGKGSYALGDIHKDVEEAINLEDKVWIEYQMNWVVKPMLIKTFGLNQLRGLTWKFDDTIKLTPKEKTEIFTSLINAGVPINREYMYEELNMPLPTPEDEEFFKKPAPMAVAPAQDEEEDQEEDQEDPEEAEDEKKPIALALSEYGGYNSIGDIDNFRDGNIVQLASSQDKARAELIRIAKAIHEGRMQRDEIPQELINLVYAELEKAIVLGVSKVELAPDPTLIQALKDNAYRFSIAKEFSMIQDLFGSLVGEDGQIKTFQQFRDDVLAIYDDYNVRWLAAEYNTAVGNSQMASKWQEFEANKENLPLLRYRAVLDDRTRHRKYNGVTLPVDHPAWDWMTPLLEYNCRCTLQQIRRGTITPEADIPGREGISQAFQFNPGKKKMVFSESHPYFQRTPAAMIIDQKAPE